MADGLDPSSRQQQSVLPVGFQVYGLQIVDDVLKQQQHAVRYCSSALFGGAQYRLEICGALQAGETVTASALMDRLPTPPTKPSVHTEVQRLLAAGLLLRLDRSHGDRHVYLRVARTSLWQTAREIAAAARASAGDMHSLNAPRLVGLFVDES